MTALAIASPSDAARRLVAAFLGGRNAATIRAYSADLGDFAAFIEAPDVNAAAAQLLGHGHGEANALALSYKSRMVEQGLAAATINRRLAALRSLVKLGRVLGAVPWTLEVQNAKAQPYRDTRGPGRAGFLALLEQLASRTNAKAVRDRAILRLLYERALRCCEVTRLDAGDVDLQAGTLDVLGKGRTAKERLTIAAPTVAAVRAWLEVRGAQAGPLFVSLDNGHRGQLRRLSGTGVYDLVRELGDAAGLRARPHGLRHAAITEALDRGTDVRAVQRFSRHRDLRILLVYDDNREDLGGKVAAAIAEPHDAQPAVFPSKRAVPKPGDLLAGETNPHPPRPAVVPLDRRAPRAPAAPAAPRSPAAGGSPPAPLTTESAITLPSSGHPDKRGAA